MRSVHFTRIKTLSRELTIDEARALADMRNQVTPDAHGLKRNLPRKKRLFGISRDFANEGLANPVYAGKTVAVAPHLGAGFGNPAEHHGKSQRAKKDPGV